MFEPKCKSGPCTTVMESRTGKYEVKLAHVKNGYAGQVIRDDTLTCAGEDIKARQEFRIEATRGEFVDDVWTARKISGFLVTSSIDSGGCLPGEERETLIGTRG